AGDLSSEFGRCVNRVGDLDNDGYEDFIVGASNYGNNGEGAAFVYSGATGTQLAFLTGSQSNDRFGAAVEGRIDIDNDGYPDILVGAPRNGADAGKVLAYSPHLQTTLYALHGAAGQWLRGPIPAPQARRHR